MSTTLRRKRRPDSSFSRFHRRRFAHRKARCKSIRPHRRPRRRHGAFRRRARPHRRRDARLRAYDRILELDIENQRAIVQPGVVNYELTRAAEPHGLYSPPTLPVKSCTIGGNVAENAGGPHTSPTASPPITSRAELVTPRGEIVASAAARRHAWLRSHRPLRRSEGTLALVTEVTVGFAQARSVKKRFSPLRIPSTMPPTTVVDITARASPPAACEMSTAGRCAPSRLSTRVFPMDSAAVLLIEVESLTEPSLLSLPRSPKLQRASCREVRVARDNAERDLSGKAQERFRALGRLAPSNYVLDGVIRFRNFASSAPHPSNRRSIRLQIRHIFHAATATCIPSYSTIPATPRNPARPESLRRIIRYCVEVGGALSGRRRHADAKLCVRAPRPGSEARPSFSSAAKANDFGEAMLRENCDGASKFSSDVAYRCVAVCCADPTENCGSATFFFAEICAP